MFKVGALKAPEIEAVPKILVSRLIRRNAPGLASAKTAPALPLLAGDPSLRLRTALPFKYAESRFCAGLVLSFKFWVKFPGGPPGGEDLPNNFCESSGEKNEARVLVKSEA